MLDIINSIDHAILLFIQEYLRTDLLTTFLYVLTKLGDNGLMWFVMAALLMISQRARWKGVLLFFSVGIGGFISSVVIKHLVERPRPFLLYPDLLPLGHLPSDTSFPSGHTTAAFAFAFAASCLFPKRQPVIFFFVLAALMAYSRIYVGAHNPSDVLAGILIGFIASRFVLYLSKTRLAEQVRRRLEGKRRNLR